MADLHVLMRRAASRGAATPFQGSTITDWFSVGLVLCTQLGMCLSAKARFIPILEEVRNPTVGVRSFLFLASPVGVCVIVAFAIALTLLSQYIARAARDPFNRIGVAFASLPYAPTFKRQVAGQILSAFAVVTEAGCTGTDAVNAMIASFRGTELAPIAARAAGATSIADAMMRTRMFQRRHTVMVTLFEQGEYANEKQLAEVLEKERKWADERNEWSTPWLLALVRIVPFAFFLLIMVVDVQVMVNALLAVGR